MTWNGCTYMTEISPFNLSDILVEYIMKGHERPMDGDRCIVEVRISLPADKDTLRDDYVYGEGVNFFGKPLVPSWGMSMVQGKRTVPMIITADSFEEAFDIARKEVEMQLAYLKSIVDVRNKRLNI